MRINGNGNTDFIKINGGGEEIYGKSVDGDNNESNDVPDVENNDDGSIDNLVMLISSLTMMVRQGVIEDVMFKLHEVLEELEEVQQKLTEDQVKVSNSQISNSMDLRMEKMEEADRKLERASRKDKGSGLWGKIKLGLNFVSAFITLASAAAMWSISGGMYPGAYASIASGCMQLVLAADALCAELTGYGLAGNMVLLCGGSKKQAKDADLSFRIALVVCILACACIAGYQAWQASQANNVTSAATAAQAAKTSGDATNASQSACSAASTIASSTVSLGTTGGDVYFAVKQFEAACLNKQGKNLQASATELQALIDTIQSLIDALSTAGINVMESLNNIIASFDDLYKSKSETLGRLSY